MLHPEDFLRLALQDAQGSPMEAARLLAQELHAQLSTGFHRLVNQAVRAPKPAPKVIE